MDAILKLKANEFSEEIVATIKSLMVSNDYTITISISNNSKHNTYWNKIDASIAEIQNNEGVSYTLESFEEFIKSN